MFIVDYFKLAYYNDTCMSGFLEINLIGFFVAIISTYIRLYSIKVQDKMDFVGLMCASVYGFYFECTIANRTLFL